MFGRKKKTQEFVNAWFEAQRRDRASQEQEAQFEANRKQMMVEEAVRRKSVQYETDVRSFVDNYTPATIEEELKEHVIGQPDLAREVADFLYYHAMRQVLPALPVRPMLIAGPSGSGKTEIWRVVKKLYGKYFKIKIVDGSKLTNDGWSGSYKLVDVFDAEMLHFGGILIVDEFDKMAKPKHTSSGDNVSAEMQSEFLKILEGEGEIAKDKKTKHTIDTRRMGFVFVGAFADLMEDLRKKKEDNRIGFSNQSQDKDVQIKEIADEEYIAYGVLTEVVNRISTKVVTRDLTEEDYICIVRNKHSRVSVTRNTLIGAGIHVPEITDEEIRELARTTKHNKTGVRWVCAQLENKMLQSIRTSGIGQKKEPAMSVTELMELIKQSEFHEEEPDR